MSLPTISTFPLKYFFLFVCFLKRENSAVSLATLYHDLNLKNKNKVDPCLYTVCDCVESGGWAGRGPGSGPMQTLRHPGGGWQAAREGLRRSGRAGLAEAELGARGKDLVQFPKRFVLKVCLEGLGRGVRHSPEASIPQVWLSPLARTTAVIFFSWFYCKGVEGERVLPPLQEPLWELGWEGGGGSLAWAICSASTDGFQKSSRPLMLGCERGHPALGSPATPLRRGGS